MGEEHTPLPKILTLHLEDPFEVELNGSPEATTAVIFVHGFGVKRQSRGLFSDLALLNLNALYVAADYSQVLSDRCVALPFYAQRVRLNKVIEYVQDHYPIKNFVFIGHSQGCITLTLEQLPNSFILLLAPPIIAPFEAFIKTKGWSNAGSSLNLQGQSCLVRSDLRIEVPMNFWTEFKTIQAESLYLDAAKKNNICIIFAKNDQILGEQHAIVRIPTYTISGADHDFSGISRNELLKLISKLILAIV